MIPIEVIYGFAYLFYVASVLIHVLVINKTIDYKLVNGGRSTSYIDQKKQSISSIIMIVLFFIYIVITMVTPSLRTTTTYIVITIIITIFWLLGTLMQLIGTTFEKKVVVWINVVGFISHLLLVLTYFEVL